VKFHSLHDPLLGLLYEDDDIVAVDKPYGIDSHTNEAKAGNEDFIVPGLIELFEANLGRRLHIVHRLDRTTTGVIVFGKSLESAKKYQQYFRRRESKKTYLFVTASRSERDTYETEAPILHKGAELEAKTSFRLLKRSARFELWEAHPKTGRHHQIRIHAAGVGLPLLGDPTYGGAKFSFLCLHNRRLQFPGEVSIESRAPSYFEDLALLEDRNLAGALHDLDRRQRLFARAFEGGGLVNETLRLMRHGEPGRREMSLDLSRSGLALAWYKETWTPPDESLYRTLAASLQKPIRVRLMNPKLRDGAGRAPEMRWESPSQAPSRAQEEEGAPVADATTAPIMAAPAIGVFPEHRLLHGWVRENTSAKSVLVLFSSSSLFGLAAIEGGAAEVTSVDSSKSALALERKTFEANGLTSAPVKFLNRDALTFLDQCHSKSRKFDLVICEAPAFARGDKHHFKIEDDLESLLMKAIDVLTPKGSLLFSTQAPALFADDVRVALLKARSALGLKDFSVTSFRSPLDCELPGEAPVLKSFLVTLDSL
jgi:23S rRNA (cytosine1962-C5)-methyltransferase